MGWVPKCSFSQFASNDMQHDPFRSICDLTMGLDLDLGSRSRIDLNGSCCISFGAN